MSSENLINRLIEMGYSRIETGGGCVALYKKLNEEKYALLTDEGGLDYPDSESCVFGEYSLSTGEMIATSRLW